MIRKMSDGWRAFGIGVVLAERGGLEHYVGVVRSDGGMFSVDDIQDHGPKTGRGDLRLLFQHILLEVIPKNASEVNIAVIVNSPKQFQEVFDNGVRSSSIPGETQ